MSVALTHAADDRSLPMPAAAALHLEIVIGIVLVWLAIGGPESFAWSCRAVRSA
jgi:hypothetical protein